MSKKWHVKDRTKSYNCCTIYCRKDSIEYQLRIYRKPVIKIKAVYSIFNSNELSFIDDMARSLDFDNFLMAKGVVDNKIKKTIINEKI